MVISATATCAGDLSTVSHNPFVGPKKWCGKVAKMIMVHFTTFVKVCSKVECAMTLVYDS